MQRRNLLKWLSAALSTMCASIIAVPGVRYLFATVQRDTPQAVPPQRVARLNDLPIGEPVEAAITGRRRDAWSIYPEETVGRVWLVRREADESAGSGARVDCYSSVCPHLRCNVSLDPSKQSFICPCHRGRFGLEGERLQTDGQRNPANRGLDALPCQIVEVNGEPWVEVTWQEFEPGISAKVTMS
ncbi:Rieske 2Fe-2S domain-containing protein [bacterium]|nr:Rieske 2Fe-2S domain-containing protein [bacterium]